MPLHNARQYVFVDECGVTTDLLRRYARSLCGTRIGDHTPCGHWQTHTVVAALRTTELTATAVFDGPIDSERTRRCAPRRTRALRVLVGLAATRLEGRGGCAVIVQQGRGGPILGVWASTHDKP